MSSKHILGDLKNQGMLSLFYHWYHIGFQKCMKDHPMDYQNVPKHLMPNHRRYEMLYFAMLGCDFICSFISLMTAVYWGQSANCESPPYKIRYFQCGNKRCDYIHTFIHSFIHTYIQTYTFASMFRSH